MSTMACTCCNDWQCSKLWTARALVTLFSFFLLLSGFLAPRWYYGKSEGVTRYFGLFESCTKLAADEKPECEFIQYDGKAGSTIQVAIGFLGLSLVLTFLDFLLVLYMFTRDWEERDCRKFMQYFSNGLAILAGIPTLLAVLFYTSNLSDIKTAEDLDDFSVAADVGFMLTFVGGELNVVFAPVVCCCMCLTTGVADDNKVDAVVTRQETPLKRDTSHLPSK